MPMVNETKPFFYLKINRNDKLGLECINHWMEIVQHLDCEFCFVCDNDGLKEKIKKQYGLSDSRFIYSYREQLEPLVNGIIPFGVISTHNWTNIASALLTPILHSKINGIDRYWNIDADDTFLYIDVKKRCEILKHAERIAEEENFDMLSLDMWHSQCNGKHWTFGVAYIRNEKDFLDILEKNKSLLTKIYKSGEVSRRLPKNLDGIFTNLHIERLIRINSFYPENVFFRHVRKINYWHHGKIIYTKPILNDWTRPIYWDDNLPKYSELPIYSGSKRIDIGIEISNSLAFIKQNRMFDEYYDILLALGTPDSYREMLSVATALANQGDSHAMIRLGRAYRDGKGVGQDLEKAMEWMRKAANKNIAWAGNELFDILWKIGTPDSYREMVSVADTFAKQNDTNAMIRLGRAYRDGKGVGQDLEKAMEWMRKAANKNSVSAGNELFDILWKIGTPDSYREMVSVADTFANQGNPHAMIRLGRAYRDGKGVGQDLEKAAEWIGQAVDMGAKWASNELVQLLLRYTKNTELAYQKAFEICVENKNEDWAKKILPYLYYNGIGTEQNIKMAKKMWIEQNVSGLSGNIEPAFVINPDLLQYDEIVLAGTKKEILLLFSICLQYNIRPDYYVTLSDCEELPEFYGNRLVLNDKTWTKTDGKAFLILSETKLKSVADECIFYIGADEPCSNVKNRNELLTPSAIFENEQLLICMDRNIGLEMKFSKPIAYTDEIDSDLPNGKILIVCSSNIALIENLMKKNKVFVDFEPFYTSAAYIYNNSRNKIKTIDLTQINKRYEDGKAIFNELDPKYQYLIAYDIAMGDQFRILSKRKGTDYSMRRFIVSEKAKDLLKVQNMEGLVISSEQHNSLITYMSMSENYHTNVLLLGYRPIYPGVGWKSDLNTIARTGSALEYNLIDIAGLNCNDPHYLNLISTEKKRKILLNPYGNNIRKRSSAETTKSYELFELLTIYLKDLGYSVYTNTPFTDQKEIPGTIRYEETIAEFVQNSTTFDFVISVFTGFIEVAMLTKVNLIVLNPGKETRIRYSKLCEHDNYWEYDILSKDVKHILDEIKNIVRVKIT